MKANPGGTITGEAILGREVEIAEIWEKLEKRSVILTAERRVGKTCVMRKMAEYPRNGWMPLLCWVEHAIHPIDCVEQIYSEASQMEAQSGKSKWLTRIRAAYQTITGVEFKGWKLPPLRDDWKRLLSSLVEDVAENTDNRLLIMLDEFPMMVSNILDISETGASLAMEFLDTLRALRQKFEPSNQIRFLLSGSIGLHLIVQDLKANHSYRGNPTNDMDLKVLSGLRREDVQLMCRKYLEEEGIRRNNTDEFDQRLFLSTDGLPLYVQYVCERFQAEKKTEVSPDDIDRELRAMMDRPEVKWFDNAAERIENYYANLGTDRQAGLILKMLSHQKHFVREKDIIDYVRSQMVVEYDDVVRSTLELLCDDNYLVRDTSTGERRYRFRYGIMRWWWEINRG